MCNVRTTYRNLALAEVKGRSFELGSSRKSHASIVVLSSVCLSERRQLVFSDRLWS